MNKKRMDKKRIGIMIMTVLVVTTMLLSACYKKEESLADNNNKETVCIERKTNADENNNILTVKNEERFMAEIKTVKDGFGTSAAELISSPQIKAKLEVSVEPTVPETAKSTVVVATEPTDSETVKETIQVAVEPTALETVKSTVAVVTESTVPTTPTAPTAPEIIKITVPESIVAPNRSKSLNVNCILQNPGMPTGCEITSTTIALNYKGVGVDRFYLADNFLPQGTIGDTNPNVAFVGSPYDPGSYGCYAPVIVSTSNNYLKSIRSDLTAYNLTGSSFEDLFVAIDNGNPVIVWATMYLAQSRPSTVWSVNGETIQWLSKEHCLVLTGYDVNRDVVYISDPLVGNVEYSLSLFKTRFNEQKQQAVVIR